jgi:hypothetical protein
MEVKYTKGEGNMTNKPNILPRIGEWQYFRMDSLPGQPWKKYWLIDKTVTALTFSSVLPGYPQYGAEHFEIYISQFLDRKGKDITSSNMEVR